MASSLFARVAKCSRVGSKVIYLLCIFSSVDGVFQRCASSSVVTTPIFSLYISISLFTHLKPTIMLFSVSHRAVSVAVMCLRPFLWEGKRKEEKILCLHPQPRRHHCRNDPLLPEEKRSRHRPCDRWLSRLRTITSVHRRLSYPLHPRICPCQIRSAFHGCASRRGTL